MPEDHLREIDQELKQHDRSIMKHDHSIGVLWVAAAVQIFMVVAAVTVLLFWLGVHR